MPLLIFEPEDTPSTAPDGQADGQADWQAGGHDEQDEHKRHDERLRREQRLRLARDFQQVRRRGRRQNSAHLTLSYVRRSTEAAGEPTRVAFVTSKKVGKAVARNRVRRWLRESVRRQFWHVAPGWDMMISARSGAAESDYHTLNSEVIELLTRARLFTSDGTPS